MQDILLMCGVMQVVLLNVTLGYLPLLDVLPQMTFLLQEEMVTTGIGGFHTSYEPPTEWWFWEDKGVVLVLMDFRIVVNSQTDMIIEYIVCTITIPTSWIR